MKNKILYLDDEKSNLDVFKATFRRDYVVFVTDSTKEAFDILKSNDIAIVISDQRMTEMTGCEFLKIAAKDYPDISRVLLTGYSDSVATIKAINEGRVCRVLSKPWDSEELKTIFNEICKDHEEKAKEKQLIKDLITVNKQLEFQLMQRNLVE